MEIVCFGNDHVAAIMDLEVTFRRNTCFVRNLDGVDMLKGNRSTNLYTINLHEMTSSSPICLMALPTSTKSWFDKSQKHQWETNDHEDIGKLGAKGDIDFFIGFSSTSYAYKDDYMGGQPLDVTRTALAAPANLNPQTPNASTTTAKIAPTPTNSSTKAPSIPNTS
ncbi:hypothetical protein Tco_0277478 [Tanacetum coccineum]